MTVSRNNLSVFTRNSVPTICTRQNHLLELQHESSVPMFVEFRIPEKKEGKFKSRTKFSSWISANQSFRDPLEFTFLRTRILIKPIEEGFLISLLGASQSREPRVGSGQNLILYNSKIGSQINLLYI